MAEASDRHSFDEDVVIIPDTPSPVFSKRMTSVGFKSRQPSVNISPIKKSNSASTLSFSPPGGALSLPGQPSFASERAEAIRRKKTKDKISNRLGDNGLSPIKRLSPDKAGFVKSSTLVNSLSGSYHVKSPNKKRNACILDSLKHDISPNMFHSPNLYNRIKGKQKNKVQNRAVPNAPARYGWPSDSDSSDDEILAGAVDSLPVYQKQSVKNSNYAAKSHLKKGDKDVQMFQDSDDDSELIAHPPAARPKQKHGSLLTTQTFSKSPSKSETFLNNPLLSSPKHSPTKHTQKSGRSPSKLVNKLFRTNSESERLKTKHKCKHPERCDGICSRSSEQRCDRNCDKQMSPGLASLMAMCSNLSSQSGSRDDLSNTDGLNNSNLTDSQTFSHNNETGALGPTSRIERKRKLETASRFFSVDLTESGNSNDNYNMTGSQTSNNSSETGAPASRLERKKRREAQSGTNAQCSNNTNETGTHVLASRQERKRRHEGQSERWLSKVPRPTGNARSKTPTKDRISVSSDDATPETRNIINVVSQLEKDEEVARKLQEELDREFALHLQDQSHDSEAGRSGSRSSEPYTEEEDYRYHSPFGDIGHHRVDNPVPRSRRRPRGQSPVSHDWHLFQPVNMARQRRRDEIPATELEQLMADTANSFHVGFEHELFLAGGPRGQRRRGRGGRTGVFTNIMLTSPNASGNDYEALMHLGEMLGDAKDKGLSKHELQRLPTTTYTGDENNPNTECHICMDDYKEGDSLKILPCFHNYHDKCIDQWIKQNATCPVCRVQIRLS